MWNRKYWTRTSRHESTCQSNPGVSFRSQVILVGITRNDLTISPLRSAARNHAGSVTIRDPSQKSAEGTVTLNRVSRNKDMYGNVCVCVLPTSFNVNFWYSTTEHKGSFRQGDFCHAHVLLWRLRIAAVNATQGTCCVDCIHSPTCCKLRGRNPNHYLWMILFKKHRNMCNRIHLQKMCPSKQNTLETKLLSSVTQVIRYVVRSAHDLQIQSTQRATAFPAPSLAWLVCLEPSSSAKASRATR